MSDQEQTDSRTIQVHLHDHAHLFLLREALEDRRSKCQNEIEEINQIIRQVERAM